MDGLFDIFQGFDEQNGPMNFVAAVDIPAQLHCPKNFPWKRTNPVGFELDKAA